MAGGFKLQGLGLSVGEFNRFRVSEYGYGYESERFIMFNVENTNCLLSLSQPLPQP